MQHEIPELDKKGLRDFALVTGAIVAGLFGLFFPWVFGFGIPKWPFIVFGVLAAWGLIAPLTLRPVYNLWMRFGMAIGWVMNRVVLTIVFIGVFLPVRVIFMIFGNDPMHRKLDAQEKTYRIKSKQRSGDHMTKPF